MYKDITTNLMVENVDEAVKFYREVLGFSEVATMPGERKGLVFAIIAKDGLMLMLQERK